MVIVATSKISFSVATLNNSWNDYPSNTIISTNVWYHLVSTYTSGNLNIYINGSLDKNYVNPTGNLISVSDGLHIGHEDAWINEYFFGIIDEIGIWSRALSAAEVAALYNGGAGLAYPF